MSGNSNEDGNFTVRIGEAPTKERTRQNGGVVCEVIDRDYHGKILVQRYRAVWECPLDAYLDYGVINEAEHKAGIKFRKAYFRAAQCRRAVYERYSKHTASIDQTYSEKVLTSAYRTLPSQTMKVIIDICGHDEEASHMGTLHTLQKGLERLAKLWGTAKVDGLRR